jgi:hypothetical protein
MVRRFLDKPRPRVRTAEEEAKIDEQLNEYRVNCAELLRRKNMKSNQTFQGQESKYSLDNINTHVLDIIMEFLRAKILFMVSTCNKAMYQQMTHHRVRLQKLNLAHGYPTGKHFNQYGFSQVAKTYPSIYEWACNFGVVKTKMNCVVSSARSWARIVDGYWLVGNVTSFLEYFHEVPLSYHMVMCQTAAKAGNVDIVDYCFLRIFLGVRGYDRINPLDSLIHQYHHVSTFKISDEDLFIDFNVPAANREFQEPWRLFLLSIIVHAIKGRNISVLRLIIEHIPQVIKLMTNVAWFSTMIREQCLVISRHDEWENIKELWAWADADRSPHMLNKKFAFVFLERFLHLVMTSDKVPMSYFNGDDDEPESESDDEVPGGCANGVKPFVIPLSQKLESFMTQSQRRSHIIQAKIAHHDVRNYQTSMRHRILTDDQRHTLLTLTTVAAVADSIVAADTAALVNNEEKEEITRWPCLLAAWMVQAICHDDTRLIDEILASSFWVKTPKGNHILQAQVVRQLTVRDIITHHKTLQFYMDNVPPLSREEKLKIWTFKSEAVVRGFMDHMNALMATTSVVEICEMLPSVNHRQMIHEHLMNPILHRHHDSCEHLKVVFTALYQEWPCCLTRRNFEFVTRMGLINVIEDMLLSLTNNLVDVQFQQPQDRTQPQTQTQTEIETCDGCLRYDSWAKTPDLRDALAYICKTSLKDENNHYIYRSMMRRYPFTSEERFQFKAESIFMLSLRAWLVDINVDQDQGRMFFINDIPEDDGRCFNVPFVDKLLALKELTWCVFLQRWFWTTLSGDSPALELFQVIIAMTYRPSATATTTTTHGYDDVDEFRQTLTQYVKHMVNVHSPWRKFMTPEWIHRIMIDLIARAEPVYVSVFQKFMIQQCPWLKNHPSLNNNNDNITNTRQDPADASKTILHNKRRKCDNISN